MTEDAVLPIRVSPYVSLILSAITAFVSGAGAPLLAVISVLKGDSIPVTAWVISVVSGLLIMSGDIRSQLHMPPVQPLTQGGKT